MMETRSKPTSVKNKRLKISPAGMITLPVAARKSLRMEKGKGSQVSVAVKDRAVELAQTNASGGFRVSPKGQLELLGDAKEVLQSGEAQHFWVELNDERGNVVLHPY
ncbi:hypothetical protein [Alteromonas sp. ASW11-130]|uniref:hypothetical protein n=1 Tax=Alteromonas sp. ASW11-130 TaxID=3015775 RepID=UPI0022424625|nr:hypothetical protein [Alteromonas sp. ASW11-130]MCW8091147.1 hypothetical protein [Alteromonas sp. ASW11-130]